ncbi:helix-turn-helix domain-containing protein [Leptolyngbya sp. DQ-M1]|uniref:helix-turn-helix domain-containing protein n=1 Tax=Leptolyngbya sp. DQ-M1 TaxID=2933920 RepID=UPI00329697AA
MNKILVIETERKAREQLIQCLEAEEFHAIGCETAQMAMQTAHQWLPHLILCGVNSSNLDGFELLASLRQQTATLPIPFIFLSDQATTEDYRRGMELGADDYLIQPSIAELLRVITVRIDRQAKLKQWYAAQSTVPSDSTIFPTVSARLQVVFDFLEAHYTEEIGLKDVAEAVGYSSTYLTHLVRKQTGQSLHSWLIQRRMKAASALLIETDRSIEEIARSVGYLNVCNFFRQFRQIYGQTPRSWRNQHRGTCDFLVLERDRKKCNV